MVKNLIGVETQILFELKTQITFAHQNESYDDLPCTGNILETKNSPLVK